MFCAVPGVSISEDGCAVTPVGRPAIATNTVPVEPLTAAALTLTCCGAPPGMSVMVPGVEENEKSAGGFEELPQEASTRQATKPEEARKIFEKEVIEVHQDCHQEFSSG